MPTSCALREEIVSAPESAPGSPNNMIKFMCSHGGKILPRPSDGRLKYVGGETRVISVTRDIRFQELMKKLIYQIEGDMVLKYQLVPEDLDALVTVKSDEDLRYMIEECERLGPTRSARLRAFLFPLQPVVLEPTPPPLSLSAEAIEQRYVDAINGIVRPSHTYNHLLEGMKLPAAKPSLGLNRSVFSISSACSSPRSPDNDGVCVYNNDHLMPNGDFTNGYNMHRVHSMPSFGSGLNGHYTPPLNESPQSHHHQQNQVHHHHHFHGYHHQSGRPMTDHYHGPKPNNRSGLVRSPGSPQHNNNNNYYYPTRESRGKMGSCNRCTMMPQFDDCGHCYEVLRRERAARSASPSPILLSPRYGHSGSGGGFRLWDGPMTSAETFN
ncbi:hypothetical protein DM860_003680 [Cuscuta australis]|uniref:PB1 domain-containing protein n=1 Tax=Cuscuta australis TaxID=267555 RepID=A0A328DL94_9ASTE|nr:hypothetical protein DM860_003680 [Cuscuta australis]